MDYCTDYIINIDNLISNIKYILRGLKPGTKMCAVVKADCYGLGYENVVPYIDDCVDMYAVASFGECKKLRAYTNKKILLLATFDLSDVDYFTNNNISVGVGSYTQLLAVSKLQFSRRLNVHLILNTGMNRYGIKSQMEFNKCVALIKKCANICLEGVYTHFATSDENSQFLYKQYDKFNKITSFLQKSDVCLHCSASYAFLGYKQYNMNMVRVGFAMYGFIEECKPLKKVLEIKSKITQIQYVKKGEGIGYDLTYFAPKNIKLGVVGLGYADGYSRMLSNNAYVLINGQKAKVIGTVCMDCFMVDITNIKNVFVGTGVTILGNSEKEELALLNYANWLNTSPYEVLLLFKRMRTNVLLKNKNKNV